MRNPGRLTCEAYEAAAMLAGTMSQKRVPMPAHFWKTGQLRWVQEPFTEYAGKRGNSAAYGIAYHADHQGLSVAGRPEHLKNIECRMQICDAKSMRRGSSRLTVEITGVSSRLLQGFDEADRRAEGFDMLHQWYGEEVDVLFGRDWDHHNGVGQWRLNPQVVLIYFRVHKANVADVMQRRAA